MKKYFLLFMSVMALLPLHAQQVGEVFYVYRNNGTVDAFLREEVSRIEYSFEDADGVTYNDIVSQLIYTADSVYNIPLAEIDSVAFGVNELKVSEAYIILDHDRYIVEEADTLNGNYQLRFSGKAPKLGKDDLISIVGDTWIMHVRITSADYSEGNLVRISSEKVGLDEIFVNGTFILSTSSDSPVSAKTNNTYCLEPNTQIADKSSSARPKKAKANLYSNTIDFSGMELHSTDFTKLYMETCRFDFNLDMVVLCNFKSREDAAVKYSRGELKLSKVVLSGKIDTDFMLRFDATGKKRFESEEVALKRNLHKPIVGKFVVGGVPILISMNTDLLMEGSYDVEGTFSTYSGFTTSNEAEVGFSWSQASGIKPYGDYHVGYGIHRPTIEGNVRAESKLSVFPRVTFSLYGLIGPSFDIKPYAKSVLALGFHDQLGSNDDDYYGAEVDYYAGYDAAVGMSFLSLLGNKPFLKSPSWNVAEKCLYEAPKRISLSETMPQSAIYNKPTRVTFNVYDFDHVANEYVKAQYPMPVKFFSNCYKFDNDFELVDTKTGTVSKEWALTFATEDKNDPFVWVDMYDSKGKIIAGAGWLPRAETCPDDKHPHLIDLGLPSGALWACCNIGAKSPEEGGGRYAWGETEVKSDYSIRTYKYAQQTTESDPQSVHWSEGYFKFINIGDNICGTDNDVAYTKWGSSWRMPTVDELRELCEECSWEYRWYVENSAGGYYVTGKNGACIYLPGSTSYRYWTGMLDPYSYSHSEFFIVPYSLKNTSIHKNSDSGMIPGFYGNHVRAVSNTPVNTNTTGKSMRMSFPANADAQHGNACTPPMVVTHKEVKTEHGEKAYVEVLKQE